MYENLFKNSSCKCFCCAVAASNMAEVSLIIASSIQFSDTFFCPWLFFLIIVFLKFHLSRKKTFLLIYFLVGKVLSLYLFASSVCRIQIWRIFHSLQQPSIVLKGPTFFLVASYLSEDDPSQISTSSDKNFSSYQPC